jgi:hypothetical protein
MKESGDEDAKAKDVKLSEMLTHSDLMDKLDKFPVREVLEYVLNTVQERSVVIYLSHHYSHNVVNVFTRDKLYPKDQSLPTQERIDAAVKRVQKMTMSARATIAPPGAKHEKDPASRGGGGGGNKKTRKGGWQNGQQQLQLQQPPSLPPRLGGGFAQGTKTGGTMGGGSGSIFYLCYLPGHIISLCPPKGA